MIGKGFIPYERNVHTLCSGKFIGENHLVYLYSPVLPKQECYRWLSDVRDLRGNSVNANGFSCHYDAMMWLRRSGHL